MNNDTSIETARAELERCDRAMRLLAREHDKAQAEFVRVQVEYNEALDAQLAARLALAAAIANEQQR
jgi:hypothetical protein